MGGCCLLRVMMVWWMACLPACLPACLLTPLRCVVVVVVVVDPSGAVGAALRGAGPGAGPQERRDAALRQGEVGMGTWRVGWGWREREEVRRGGARDGMRGGV